MMSNTARAHVELMAESFVLLIAFGAYFIITDKVMMQEISKIWLV